jgi:hypothetical protein
MPVIRRKKMARANNNGWDFIKVGKEYQYKEDHFVGMVKILEDNSDEEMYRFKIQVMKANCKDIGPEPFDVSHSKNPGGYYSGMLQFYETPEYIVLPIGSEWPCDYTKNNEWNEIGHDYSPSDAE